MANPIIRIKTGNQDAYGNCLRDEVYYLPPLETGELAYNAYNNGLYIGYNGTNYLLSVANSNIQPEEIQTFNGTALNANVATKLGTINVGSSTIPIYLNKGAPTKCGDTLDVNISKNAATATKWAKNVTFKISETANTTGTSVDGSQETVSLILPKTLKGLSSVTATTFTGNLSGTASVATKLGTIDVGSETRPIYIKSGTPTICNETLAVNITGSANNAATWTTGRTFTINGTAGGTAPTVKGDSNVILVLPTTLSGFTSIGATSFNGNLNGTANISLRLGTIDIGDESTPIYLDGGEPKVVTSLDLDTSGNAATATKWNSPIKLSISKTANSTASNTPIEYEVDGSENIILTIPKDIEELNSVKATTVTAGTLNGALAASYLTGAVAIAKGGTGATTATKALENLGLTATAKELNALDGIETSVTADNLSYVTSTTKTKGDATNIAYGTCSTAAATAAKAITISGNTNWKLEPGSFITIVFTNTNTAQNPTFNVNGTGAKSVYYVGAQITTSNLSYGGYAKRPMNFVYDGTGYIFVGWGYESGNTNTQLRVYRQTSGYDGNYPLLVGRTAVGSIGTANTNSSYAGVYGVMVEKDGTGTDNPLPTLYANPNKGIIYATTFNGNATSASKWATSRAFSISGQADGTAVNVNGSAAVELTLPKTLTGFTSISAGTLNGALAVEHITGILPLNKGGTGANLKKETRTPNAIIRYTSSDADYFSSTPTASGAFYATAANGSPAFGTLPVAQGGTGTSSQTAYRMIISSSDKKSLISSNHFADNKHLYINHDPEALDQYNSANSSYKLYVNGISRFNGDISLTSGTDITPEEANDSWLGSATKPFYEIISRRFYLFDGINATSYGRVAVSSNAGIATTTQNAYLQLGNDIATGTVNNAYGLITLYGHKNSYTSISKDITNDINNNGSTTKIYNNHLYLPEIETVNYEGEFVIHKNNTEIGSASLPVYVAASGLVTACSPEEVFEDFSESVDITTGNGQTLSLTIADETRSLQLSAATDTYGGIITKNSQTLAGDKTLKGNYFSQSTNPYFGFKDSSGVIQGYVQYVQSSDDFAIGTSYAKGLQITAEGDISIPEARTITPRKDATGSIGTSSYEWNEGYFRNLKSDGTIYIIPSTNLYLQCGSSNNIYAHSILPEDDMGYNLGSTTYTWKNIYAHGITLYDGTNGYDGGNIYTTSSNATTAQSSYAILGNAISTGTAGNRYGLLRLYSEGAPYLDLRAYRYATNSTSTAATSRTIYLRDHGAEAYLAATTTRNQIGNTRKPVYVTNAGVIVACKNPIDGNYWDGVVNVTSEGASNIGKYLDFHTTDVSTNNYDTRIQSTGATANIIYLPEITGQMVVHKNDTQIGSGIIPVYVSSAGQVTASNSTVGTAAIPVYMSSGTISECTPSSVFSVFSSTAGTTTGETLSITVATKNRTLTLDAATASQSGVVTTGTQTFAGAKTLYGNFVVTNSDSTSTTARSVKATTANGSVGVYQSTNRGLYDFTKDGWIIYSDTSNSNAVTIPSRLHVPYITVTSTSSGEHIKFSREGYNYITYPAGGVVAINCGSSLGSDYSQLIISESSVRSGTGASLGTSGLRWEGVYGRTFHAQNSSSSTSNASFTVANYDGSCSVSLLYGSGQQNAGIYDNVNGQWMIYRALGTGTELAQKTTRFPGGVAFTSAHGTSTPGTSTAGYGVTGAVFFKRI